MRRGQIFILIVMSIITVILFSIVAIWGITLINSNLPASVNEPEIVTAPSPTPTITPTPSATPTNTPIPTPTDTPIPTPTNTRVVHDTATPTPSKTPTPAPPTETPTNTPISRSGGGSVAQVQPTITPLPASLYPLQLVEGPVAYTTTNHFLVILAQVTANNTVPLANYKMIGSHSPTGVNWESLPSCNHWCKASGPPGISNKEGTLLKQFSIREGNLVFEFPFYEEGVFSLMLVDPQGRQASEVFQLKLEGGDKERKWFFVRFNR